MWTITGKLQEYAEEWQAIHAAVMLRHSARMSVQIFKNGEVIRLLRY